MDKARNRALKIINAVHEQSAYANVALAKELRRVSLVMWTVVLLLSWFMAR